MYHEKIALLVVYYSIEAMLVCDINISIIRMIMVTIVIPQFDPNNGLNLNVII